MTAQPKIVLWFGNAGTFYGDFGLPNIRMVLPALRTVGQDIPLKLVCVSNDQKKFESIINDSGVPSEFVQWSREECLRRIKDADVCIVPNSRDRFSIVKSANRLALSLSLGTPVVATSTPAAACLAPYVIFDDWSRGIRTYLSDPVRAKSDAEAGKEYVARCFSAASLAQKWVQVLANIEPRKVNAAVAPTVHTKDVERFHVLSASDIAKAEALLIAPDSSIQFVVVPAAIARRRPKLLALAVRAGCGVQII